MSGNSKVIGVTMSRSASEQQLPLSYVTADMRSYCSLVWAIIVSVKSHQFCLSGSWKPDNLLYLYYLYYLYYLTELSAMLQTLHWNTEVD